MVSLTDEIKKYKTKELIDFLCKKEDLELNKMTIKILEKEEVNSWNFLKVTEEKLCSYEMADGPVTRLTDFTKKCKYKIDSNDIKKILPFKSESVKIDDADKYFQYYITEIK